MAMCSSPNGLGLNAGFLGYFEQPENRNSRTVFG